MQRHVFRGVAIATDAVPRMLANLQHQPICQSNKLRGQGRHHVHKLQTAVGERCKYLRVLQAMRAKKRLRLVAFFRRRIGNQCPGRVVIGGADIEGHVPVMAQPMGQPQVVRVHMCGQHPQHWQTHQG